MRFSLAPSLFRSRSQTWAVALATLVLASGCAALPEGLQKAAPFAALEEQPVAPADSAAMCTVEIHPEIGRVQTKRVPVAADSFVGDMLLKSGVYKRFKRLDATLLRQEASGQVAKMTVKVVPGTKQVAAESDYHVLPGDKIIVKESTVSALDEMLGSLMGPIGTAKR